ncbi:uncharacterized protein EAF01_003850 [Botrytis porri]|uniref:uncharacterized protein n=1 Tax=Botrytis porri TaxID=87229 RepID=UPI0018FF3364|nr:uncharacterized protein EAF01_003850 [Botrytis porri]KAF7908095.1 hypothetical protein EAF01_003850 [Botrytis porri]
MNLTKIDLLKWKVKANEKEFGIEVREYCFVVEREGTREGVKRELMTVRFNFQIPPNEIPKTTLGPSGSFGFS